jgi:hypothetical protein
MDASVVAKFWVKVNRRGPLHSILKTRCWLWLGPIGVNGYGRFSFDGLRVPAHRVAWLIARGRWPYPHGLHKCDNPPCCNPAHLFEGTQQDNNLDMLRKGRASGGRLPGELNKNSKLTTELVLAIRSRYLAGGVSQRELGREFGVSNVQVANIVHKRVWKNV